MSDLYRGVDVVVKPIKREDGTRQFGLFRPGEKHSCLDVFADADYAILVAWYVDEHGGSYAAVMRKRAKEFAKSQLSVDSCNGMGG